MDRNVIYGIIAKFPEGKYKDQNCKLESSEELYEHQHEKSKENHT